MSTIKNGYISLYFRFNKIIKKPGTSSQSPGLSQKHIGNIYHTAHQYLTKFHFDNYFHYVAMPMVTSQILKSMDFTKIQKSRYFENEALFFLQIKRFINYI